MQTILRGDFSLIKIPQSYTIQKIIGVNEIAVMYSYHGDDREVNIQTLSSIKTQIHPPYIPSLISTILFAKLETEFIGCGISCLSHNFELDNKAADRIYSSDKISIIINLKEKNEKDRTVLILYEVYVNDVVILGKGSANIFIQEKAQNKKIMGFPKLRLLEDKLGKGYEIIHHKLIELGANPINTAIVYPTDSISIELAIEGARDNIIIPILIGPEQEIKNIAKINNFQIDNFRLINANSHIEAANIAAELAQANQIDCIVKGNIHTDQVLSPILSKEYKLRTNRRMSHVFIMGLPTYHKPLFVTDAVININPNLQTKIDIAQNAINLFISLFHKKPKVAILSAVETVNPKMQSTIDATILSKMSERGQIKGGIIDGPLAFDNAISMEAAKAKGIVSEVAGDADIIIVPDIEAGNILFKQMSFLSDAKSVGIVLGAKIPIVITSRAEGDIVSRKGSCALAQLYTILSNI